MTYDWVREERCRQITALLAYPKVGPLSAAAIAINLGASEDDIQIALESLLQQGHIVRTRDGRLSGPSALDQERAGASESVESEVTRLERGEFA